MSRVKTEIVDSCCYVAATVGGRSSASACDEPRARHLLGDVAPGDRHIRGRSLHSNRCRATPSTQKTGRSVGSQFKGLVHENTLRSCRDSGYDSPAFTVDSISKGTRVRSKTLLHIIIQQQCVWILRDGRYRVLGCALDIRCFRGSKSSNEATVNLAITRTIEIGHGSNIQTIAGSYLGASTGLIQLLKRDSPDNSH